MDLNSLDRFVKAQENTYIAALKEIQSGKKRTHWMWFIFPQLRGLGESKMSYTYGIIGIEEARAYLAHPVLSQRLTEITQALLAHKGKSPTAIFGYIDDLKLQSCMTLFASVSEPNSVFHQVLDAFFDGKQDLETLRRIK